MSFTNILSISTKNNKIFFVFRIINNNILKLYAI